MQPYTSAYYGRYPTYPTYQSTPYSSYTPYSPAQFGSMTPYPYAGYATPSYASNPYAAYYTPSAFSSYAVPSASPVSAPGFSNPFAAQSVPGFSASPFPLASSPGITNNVYSQGNSAPVAQTSGMACGIACLSYMFNNLGIEATYAGLDKYFRGDTDMGLSLQWIADGVNRSGQVFAKVYNNTNLNFMAQQLAAGNQVMIAYDKWHDAGSPYADQDGGPQRDPGDSAGHYAVLKGIEIRQDGGLDLITMNPDGGKMQRRDYNEFRELMENIDFSGRNTGINNAVVVVGKQPLPDIPQYAFTGAAKAFDDSSYRYNQQNFGL